MGEVIKFDFKNEKYVPDNKQVEGDEDRNNKEFDKVLNTRVFAEMLIFLRAFMRTDSRSVNFKNIDLRRSELEKCSDEDLFTRVNESNQNDWQAHPSYFHSLIAEITGRHLI